MAIPLSISIVVFLFVACIIQIIEYGVTSLSFDDKDTKKNLIVQDYGLLFVIFRKKYMKNLLS